MIKQNLSQLSPVMCFALLLVTMLGLDFLLTPYEAARICGPSSYWVVLAALLMIVPLGFLLWGIQKRFPGCNLLEAGVRSLGKVFGTVGNLFYLGVFLFQIIVVQRHAIEFISTYLLDRTPVWAIYTFVLLGISYIAINGVSAVSRLAGFVLIPAFFFRLVLNLFGMQNLNLYNLLPVFTVPVTSYFQAGLSMTDVFVPLGGLFMIYPLLSKPNKLGVIFLGTAGTTAFMMLLSIIGTIGVFGDRMAATFSWPIFELVRRISFPYFVLDQMGLLLVIVWFTMFFAGSAFYMNLLGAGINQIFSKLKYPWTTAGILILVEIGGLSFPDLQVNIVLFTHLSRWIIIPITVYPLIVYLAALIRDACTQICGGRNAG